MVGKIISFVACVICAIPLFIISKYDKESFEPINFWSGDTTLKTKVKDVANYNKEMALLYKRCAIALLITGVCYMIFTLAGVILVCFDCTLGIYIVYRSYKKILNRYS